MKQWSRVVGAGHPDKLCDTVAEALVDEYTRRDAGCRLDLRVSLCHGILMIGGHVNSATSFDLGAFAAHLLTEKGYTSLPECLVNIGEEPFVHEPVVMRGYATASTPHRLPLGISMAQRLSLRLEDMRHLDPFFSWMGGGGSVLVGTEGNHISEVQVFCTLASSVDTTQFRSQLFDRVLLPIVGVGVTCSIQIALEEEGALAKAVGSSGQQMAADFYGDTFPLAGPSLIGKDASSPHRLGAYAARLFALHLLEKTQAKAASVLLPIFPEQETISAITFQLMEPKEPLSEEQGTQDLQDLFSFHLPTWRQRFSASAPPFRSLAVGGMVGRPGLPWEQLQTEKKNPPVK